MGIIVTLTHGTIAMLNWIRKCQVREALVLKKRFSIICLQIFKHHKIALPIRIIHRELKE